MAKPKVAFNIPLAQDVAMKAAERGVRAATLEAKRILQVDVLSSDPPRTGLEYSRGKTAAHRASDLGEAPAPDTGQLRAATDVEFTKSETVAHGKVVNNLAKAVPLETGTEKMAARPFMSVLLSRAFVARIKEAFDRGAFRGRP